MRIAMAGEMVIVVKLNATDNSVTSYLYREGAELFNKVCSSTCTCTCTWRYTVLF